MLGHSSTHWGPVPVQLGHKLVTLTNMRDPVSTDFPIIVVVLLFLDFSVPGSHVSQASFKLARQLKMTLRF